MSTPFILDAKAEKTRKHWLRFSVFLWILLPIISLSESLVAYFADSKDSEIAFSLANLAFSFLVFLVLYLYAYKKTGTKFFYFSVLLRIWSVINGVLDFVESPFDSIMLTMLIINVVLLIYWIYIGEKLTRLNRKIKMHKRALQNSEGASSKV